MTMINNIQIKIKQLEGGRFQKLCDEYLKKTRKWDNIQSLGSQDGSDKTTKGIPDAYSYKKSNEKYILIMHGTQKGTHKKLQSDITEAIHKSGISHDKIEKIICCHISSNLPLDKFEELKKAANGIEIEIIGIDTLAHDLKNKIECHSLAEEYLGIKINSQVWDLESFIRIHDKSKTNPKLTTYFVQGDLTLNHLMSQLKENQILVLTGDPGIGKTKIAVELLKSIENEENNILCLKSNGLSAYDEIVQSLDSEKMNYLFLDDINLVTNFEAVIALLNNITYEESLKIIITIRNYAFKKIINAIKHYSFKIEKIEKLHEEELRSLLLNLNNNYTSKQLDFLIKISNCNTRLAVIASMLDDKNQNSNYNEPYDILSFYYSNIISENNLSTVEKKTLFVLSFLKKIIINKLFNIKEVLALLGLNQDDFKECIYTLHDKELCNIDYDEIATIADQSLADYISIHFINESRRISLRNFFINLYPKYTTHIIEMLNQITTFDKKSSWLEYLSKELEYIYSNHIIDLYKEEFLIHFGSVIPRQIILFLNDYISSSKAAAISALTQKDFEDYKGKSNIQSNIVIIISKLASSVYHEQGIISLFEYFNLHPENIHDIYLALTSEFFIDVNKSHINWKDIDVIIELIKENTHFIKNNYTTALLLTNTLLYYLKFNWSKYQIIGNQVTHTNIKPCDNNDLLNFHNSAIKLLFKIYQKGFGDINNKIEHFIWEYPLHKFNSGFQLTIISNLNTIFSTFFSNIKTFDFKKEALFFNLVNKAQELKIPIKIDDNIEPSENNIIYSCFSFSSLDYYNNKAELLNKIEPIILQETNLLTSAFEKLSDYQNEDLLNANIDSAIFHIYCDSPENKKVKMLIAIINSGIELKRNLYYYFKELSYEAGHEVIHSISQVDQNKWLIYNLVSFKNIKESQYNRLENKISDLNSYNQILGLNILDFQQYIHHDKKILDIFLSKVNENIDFLELFIPHFVSEELAELIINLVGSHTIKELYLKSLANNSTDVHGEMFKYIIVNESTVDFLFSYFKIASKNKMDNYLYNNEYVYEYFWESEHISTSLRNFIMHLDEINRIIYIGLDSTLKEILESNKKESFKFIYNEILNSTDEHYLMALLNISVETYSLDLVLQLYRVILNKSIPRDFFNNIQLLPSSYSWTGSMVPLIDSHLVHIKNLKTIFKGTKYITFLQKIIEMEQHLDKKKHSELINDFLE